MTDDNQENAIAPKNSFRYHRHRNPITVDEALSLELNHDRPPFRRATLCCGIISATIIVIAMVILILGLTTLHVKNPKIKLDSFNITNGNLVTTNGNLTVNVDLSVKNPNAGVFKFDKVNSSLLYHDRVVGGAEVPGIVTEARRTARFSVTFPVEVAKVAGDSRFVSDLATGVLPVDCWTEINGRVKIWNVVKRNVTVKMNCTIVVSVVSMQIVSQDCLRHVHS